MCEDVWLHASCMIYWTAPPETSRIVEPSELPVASPQRSSMPPGHPAHPNSSAIILHIPHASYRSETLSQTDRSPCPHPTPPSPLPSSPRPLGRPPEQHHQQLGQRQPEPSRQMHRPMGRRRASRYLGRSTTLYVSCCCKSSRASSCDACSARPAYLVDVLALKFLDQGRQTVLVRLDADSAEDFLDVLGGWRGVASQAEEEVCC